MIGENEDRPGLKNGNDNKIGDQIVETFQKKNIR